MPAVQLIDRMAIDAGSNLRRTVDGYLVAVPRVARTGIQLYRGSEVGQPQMDIVRVYRPEAEVFNKDSLATFGHKPITNDHPPKPVTSDNWRTYSVGAADGEVARDGEYVRIPMCIMDAKAISDVEEGKSELSVGYSTELKWDTGVTPAGDAYDAIQTAIRVNHIAIVDAARGGPKLKIGDAETGPSQRTPADSAADAEESDMSDAQKKVVSVMVDGIALEMGDTAAAIVTKTVDALAAKLKDSTALVATMTTQATDAKTAHDAAIAKLTTESTTALAAKDAEIVALKKQVEDSKLTPAALDKLVSDRAIVFAKARAVVGDKLVVDGKTVAEVMKQTVDAKLGDKAKDWSADQIQIGFDTLTAEVKVDTATIASGVTDAARAFSAPSLNMGDKAKAQREADKKLENKWKTPVPA